MRASVLAFAREQAARQQRSKAALAEISPSPLPLITAVLSDPCVVAAVAEGGVVVDMGLGDGRWLFAALEHFGATGKGAVTAVGVEIDAERIALTRKLMAERGLGAASVEIVHADFQQVVVTAAAVVFVYLSREGNRLLSAKLSSELRKGSIVVAIGFSFSWTKALLNTHKCPATGLPAFIYSM